MVEVINIFSLIMSIIAVVYLLYITTTQTAKGLRTGFLLLAFGILVAVVFHSLAEALERLGFLSNDLLSQIMPILVLLGSFLILAGAYTLYKTFKKVSGGYKEK
jgi:EamA domain-containing membrane protein RarD